MTARNATMPAIAENLNKSQRTTVEKMLGDPFEFPKTSDRQPAAHKAAQGEKTFAPEQSRTPVNQ